MVTTHLTCLLLWIQGHNLLDGITYSCVMRCTVMEGPCDLVTMVLLTTLVIIPSTCSGEMSDRVLLSERGLMWNWETSVCMTINEESTREHVQNFNVNGDDQRISLHMQIHTPKCLIDHYSQRSLALLIPCSRLNGRNFPGLSIL